jgi:hypothetical protein
MTETAATETQATEAVPLRTAPAASEQSATWIGDAVPLRDGAERADEEERAERLRLLTERRRVRRR